MVGLPGRPGAALVREGRRPARTWRTALRCAGCNLQAAKQRLTLACAHRARVRPGRPAGSLWRLQRHDGLSGGVGQCCPGLQHGQEEPGVPVRAKNRLRRGACWTASPSAAGLLRGDPMAPAIHPVHAGCVGQGSSMRCSRIPAKGSISWPRETAPRETWAPTGAQSTSRPWNQNGTGRNLKFVYGTESIDRVTAVLLAQAYVSVVIQ